MLFSLALLIAAPAPLADIHVDVAAAGCLTGTGTAADPVCSINGAIGLASPGDTVLIEPGTYHEKIVIPYDINLVSTGGAEVTIVDASQTGSVLSVPFGITATVEGLTLTHGESRYGGGAYCAGTLTLRDSIITDNLAKGTFPNIEGAGGGVAVTNGDLTIERCEIHGNRATSPTPTSFGGGLFASNAVLNVIDTTIAFNEATDGGGVHALASNTHIEGSTISNNTALSVNGGLSLRTLRLEMTNSTVSSNTATHRGGLHFFEPNNGSLVSNCTITENVSELSGGGLITSELPFFLVVRNNIIAGNRRPSSSPTVPIVDIDGAFVSFGHNLIGVDNGGGSFVDGVMGDQVGTVAAPLDARLNTLQDNGGPTKTHDLLPGSPAIDAGDRANFEPFDQRGIARPLGAASEIGAVESEGAFNGLCHGNGGNQVGCTNCPCGNNAGPLSSGGCLNSAGTSAELLVSGEASVSLPLNSTSDLRFGMRGLPPSAFTLLNSGDTLAPTGMANPCFGMGSGVQALVFDGLRCAVVNTRRHGGRFSDINGVIGESNLAWGGSDQPHVGIAVAHGGFVAGQTRYFQAINREDPLLSCMRGLNTSQAIEVTFTP